MHQDLISQTHELIDYSKWQMEQAVKLAEERLGPIDCLIPNAGVASGGEASTSKNPQQVLKIKSI